MGFFGVFIVQSKDLGTVEKNTDERLTFWEFGIKWSMLRIEYVYEC